MDILGRTATCERASIDECYLDLSAEARKRLAAGAGRPQHPTSFERVHVCTESGPVSPFLHMACDLPLVPEYLLGDQPCTTYVGRCNWCIKSWRPMQLPGNKHLWILLHSPWSSPALATIAYTLCVLLSRSLTGFSSLPFANLIPGRRCGRLVGQGR